MYKKILFAPPSFRRRQDASGAPEVLLVDVHWQPFSHLPVEIYNVYPVALMGPRPHRRVCIRRCVG